jgi:hypothetical protein
MVPPQPGSHMEPGLPKNMLGFECPRKLKVLLFGDLTTLRKSQVSRPRPNLHPLLHCSSSTSGEKTTLKLNRTLGILANPKNEVCATIARSSF